MHSCEIRVNKKDSKNVPILSLMNNIFQHMIRNWVLPTCNMEWINNSGKWLLSMQINKSQFEFSFTTTWTIIMGTSPASLNGSIYQNEKNILGNQFSTSQEFLIHLHATILISNYKSSEYQSIYYS